MSTFQIFVVVAVLYFTVGLLTATVRFVSYMDCKKKKAVVSVAQIYFCDLFLWWLKPAVRLIWLCLHGNRLNVVGFERVVTGALKQGFSDADLEDLKRVIFQEQQKAIAAGNSPEQEAVNRWIRRIDEKIERRKTGADFRDFLYKMR